YAFTHTPTWLSVQLFPPDSRNPIRFDAWASEAPVRRPERIAKAPSLRGRGLGLLPRLGSNQRPFDEQTNALPTELRRKVAVTCGRGDQLSKLPGSGTKRPGVL